MNDRVRQHHEAMRALGDANGHTLEPSPSSDDLAVMKCSTCGSVWTVWTFHEPRRALGVFKHHRCKP